jgi:hypothetical protein
MGNLVLGLCHASQILGTVIRSVSVDVMNLFGPSHATIVNAMLVNLYVFLPQPPPQTDISVAGQIPSRIAGRYNLTRTQLTDGNSIPQAAALL